MNIFRIRLGDVEAAECACGPGIDGKLGAMAARAPRLSTGNEPFGVIEKLLAWSVTIEPWAGISLSSTRERREGDQSHVQSRAHLHEEGEVVRNERHAKREGEAAEASSGVVRGSEIMKNAKIRSEPLCSWCSGIASGSPSHSARAASSAAWLARKNSAMSQRCEACSTTMARNPTSETNQTPSPHCRGRSRRRSSSKAARR